MEAMPSYMAQCTCRGVSLWTCFDIPLCTGLCPAGCVRGLSGHGLCAMYTVNTPGIQGAFRVLSAAAVRAGYSRCFQQQLCDSHDHLRRTLSASKNAGAVLRAVSSSVEALMTLPWCKYIWAVPKCGSGAEGSKRAACCSSGGQRAGETREGRRVQALTCDSSGGDQADETSRKRGSMHCWRSLPCTVFAGPQSRGTQLDAKGPQRLPKIHCTAREKGCKADGGSRLQRQSWLQELLAGAGLVTRTESLWQLLRADLVQESCLSGNSPLGLGCKESVSAATAHCRGWPVGMQSALWQQLIGALIQEAASVATARCRGHIAGVPASHTTLTLGRGQCRNSAGQGADRKRANPLQQITRGKHS
eukprot:1159143-Pelagomonas_calceolata.AAC.7